MTIETSKVSFRQDQDRDFQIELRKRVTQFFKENGKSPKANLLMIAKSLFFMGISTALYLILISGYFGSYSLILFPILGFCSSIGMMNIVHDALHGSYTNKSFTNRVLGFGMDLLGVSSFYWKKEHTLDHHTYTNISGHDADLDVPFLLRLCPKAPLHKIHRFQHFYAPILYGLNLIHWMYYSDIKRMIHIVRNYSSQKIIPLKEIIPLFCFKLVHMFIFIVCPIMLLPNPFWQTILGYMSMLATAGLTLTVIFQLAHIVENAAFPLPDHEGKMPQDFFRHQLSTTANFATKSRFVTFLFGGLNFQVEHHLFPHICHIHLPKIAPLVKQTAKEFGMPYFENCSFTGAVFSHFRFLKNLGIAKKH